MSDDCDETTGIPGQDLQNVPKIIKNNVRPASLHKVTRFNVLSMSLKSEIPYLPDKRWERTCSLKQNLLIFNVTSTESDTKSDNGNTSNVSILESLL